MLVYFDSKKYLHINMDRSKEFGFKACVYYLINSKIKPILFLSRLLTKVEKSY